MNRKKEGRKETNVKRVDCFYILRGVSAGREEVWNIEWNEKSFVSSVRHVRVSVNEELVTGDVH